MWPGAEGEAVPFLRQCETALGASPVGRIPAGESGRGGQGAAQE